MGLKNFFRFFFGGHSWVGSTDNAPFKSLYTFTATFGYQIYKLAFETVIFLALIMTGIAFLKGYAAKDAQGRVENKDKIMRNVLIILIAVSLTFIISTVYKIFSWHA